MITIITKIMNNRVTTNTGKTITVGGLFNSSELELAAQEYNVQAENIKKSSVLADGTFNTLTEVIHVAKQVADVNAVTNDSKTFIKLGNEFKTELTNLLETTVDGKKILAETTKIDLGIGSGSIEVGINLADDLHYKIIEEATNTMAIDGQAYGDQKQLDSAVDGLFSTAAAASAKASFLDNRYHTLNDLAANTKIAAKKQLVQVGGSPTSLFNTLS